MIGDLDVLLVGGELRRARGGRTFDTINPATEEVLGPAADATAEDMDEAIAAARRAFDSDLGGWTTDVELRARCLRQLREAMLGQGAGLRDLTVAEAGSPIFLTYGPQLDTPVEGLGWCADTAGSLEWRKDLGVASPMGVSSRRWLLREPVGVVGAITPWNFPHQLNLAKLGPALAAGNTVVLKAAPDTPWCAAVLARLIVEETEIPPGVVNVITSSDHELGARLSSDPRVDLVSFTGSTATGRKVMAAGAETIKRVFLELGGKSAFIVLDDADLDAAAATAAFAISTHAGQGCALTTRLLVPRQLFDDVVEMTATNLAKIGCGDPRDEATVCGPLISARQRDRVETYLRLAKEEGGTFVGGGGRPDSFDRGYWVEPTLIVGLGNASRVAREEIFGPVLVVIPYDGDADAVDIANDSPYGLSGAVWGSPDRAWNIARRVRTGTMSVNGGVWYAPDAPFGGYKQSGTGREMGVEGIDEYLETKLVAEPGATQ